MFKVVLAVFDNVADCKAEEQRLLDIHVGLPDNMNISRSSDGNAIGNKHTEESKAKMSAANSGENHPQYGKKHTEEHKAKLSIVNSGETASNAKLTESDVLEIRRLYATGDYTQKELSIKFNVNQQTISKIILRKLWKYI